MAQTTAVLTIPTSKLPRKINTNGHVLLAGKYHDATVHHKSSGHHDMRQLRDL